LPWFAMSPVSIVILYQYSIHHIVIIYSISINNTTEINSITPSSYVSFFRRIELRVNSSAKVQITSFPANKPDFITQDMPGPAKSNSWKKNE
jgi:hypothetical protein